MNKKIALILALAFLLFSATLSMANAEVTREKHSVPFKAEATATATPTGNPVNGILGISILGSGTATLMGKVSVSQQMSVNLATGEFFDGTFAWTAANGDKVFGIYHGNMIPTSDPTVSLIDGVFTFTGGTGRFEGATGGGTASGKQFTTGSAELKLDGTITSVGSK